MKKKIKIVCKFLIISFLLGCHTTKEINHEQNFFIAQKIDLAGFGNLYKVDEHLFRSEQPDSKGMIVLQDLGIGAILNVRNNINDNRKIVGTNLELIHFPMRAGAISYEEVIESLKIIIKTPKKVLVHCKHGSDRTGCVVAAYRMAISGWTKKQAINEFLNPQFGYHGTWFPNILNLLNTLDIEKLKKDIEISK